MNTDALLSAQESFITEKYGLVHASHSEYGYTSDNNSLTTRIFNAQSKLIAYLTSWEDNGQIQHHLYNP